MWGRPVGRDPVGEEAADAKDGELLEDADFLREEPRGERNAAGEEEEENDANPQGPPLTRGEAAVRQRLLQREQHKQRTGDGALFDEEAPPFLPGVLLHDAAARLRKHQMLLAALNDLTQTEVRHEDGACAAAAEAAASRQRRDSQQGEHQQQQELQGHAENAAAPDRTLESERRRERQDLQHNNPKLLKVLQSVFGKRRPLGRFGALGEGPSQTTASTPAWEEEKRGAFLSSQSARRRRSSKGLAEVNAAAPVTTIVTSISPSALRNLKDANLLLKREGSGGDGARQLQHLYDVEDGHLLYQHPRFCAFSIFVRDNIVRPRASSQQQPWKCRLAEN